MSDKQVDYDRIAPSYDQRYIHGSGQMGIAEELQALARGKERIVEVGCGTGHWLAGLRSASGMLFGLDLSAGMLAQAQARGEPLYLVHGRACCLPFGDACTDLVYCVNAIHHFQRQRDFIFEVRRLLRPGGSLVVIGSDPRAHRHGWYIYDYFPGTYETDLDRFPSWGMAADWMIEAGFEQIEWRLVERIEDHKLDRGIYADPFLQKDACSQLALLSDEAYAAGLRRIATALAEAEARGESITFPTDLWQAMLVGRIGA
ncbi:MAG: class I SAM-dependent methyltransferase [Anaerolineae bacterium]|jgi:SAM-dependent methyltransferase